MFASLSLKAWLEMIPMAIWALHRYMARKVPLDVPQILPWKKDLELVPLASQDRPWASEVFAIHKRSARILYSSGLLQASNYHCRACA